MTLSPSTVQEVARCRGCGYALRGLAEPAGAPSAAGRSTRPTRRRCGCRRPAAAAGAGLVHVAGDVGLIALGLTAVGRWTGGDALLALGWLAWVLLAVLLLGQRVAGVLDWVTGPLTPPAAVVAAASRRLAGWCLLAAVACGVSWGTCPHSRWVVVGPVGVCHSPDGMCDNVGSPAGYLVPLADGWYLIGCDQYGRP